MEENEIKTMLDEEIKSEIKALSTLEVGSKELEIATTSVANLYRLKLEEVKAENEKAKSAELDFKRAQFDEEMKAKNAEMEFKRTQFEEEMKAKNAETVFKLSQVRDQNRHQYIRLGLDVASLVAPMIFYGIWMRKGFKFEETGTFTSTTFRGLFNRFKPTKN